MTARPKLSSEQWGTKTKSSKYLSRGPENLVLRPYNSASKVLSAQTNT